MRKKVQDYWNKLTPQQQAEHDAAAIVQANAEQLKLIEPGPTKKFGMGILRHGYIREILESRQSELAE
jgi:hypothetical protein